MPFQNIHPSLRTALVQQGFEALTAVQAAIAETPVGADLLVSAQTGSGKTVAFGLALAADLLGEAPRFEPPAFPDPAPPQSLIIAPTRELALQVSRELTWLMAHAGARIVTCVGGMDARREQRALAAGTHFVVGTPGRLRDHLERGNLDLSALKAVVLDEADEMLDLGFREDLEEILDATPAERRTLLFSATISREIATLARKFQRDAVRIDTIRRDEPHGDIEYRATRCAPNELEHAVVNVLRYFEAPSALIFCATREAVRHLHGALRERGFNAVALSGEMSQKERTDALQALRDGHARACVATDVAARGLDLPALDLVIHAELPQNKAALLHRSGRTGRAGRKGVSVLLVPYTRQRKAEQLLASAKIEAVWSGPPLADEIRKRDEVRLRESPILTEAPSDEDLALGRSLLEGTAPEVIAAALVRMHRSQLPEPEEMFDNPQYDPMKRDRGGPRDGPPGRERRGNDEGPRPPRREMSRETVDGDAGVWFRMPIGRRQNADPKWLVPLICRRGHVTKKDIGEIRIFDGETKFQISQEAQERFREASGNIGKGDVRIEPAGAPPDPRESGPRESAPRESAPREHRPRPERVHEPHVQEARPEPRPQEARAESSQPQAPRPQAPRPKPKASYVPKTGAHKPGGAKAAGPNAGGPRPFKGPPRDGAFKGPAGPRPPFKGKPRKGPPPPRKA